MNSQFLVSLLMLAYALTNCHCSVDYVKNENGKTCYTMPNGIDYVKAHFAVVENWQGKEVYVIDINLRPAMTGTYNFCICDISTNENNLHGGGEALAENCLDKCKNVEDGAFLMPRIRFLII